MQAMRPNNTQHHYRCISGMLLMMKLEKLPTVEVGSTALARPTTLNFTYDLDLKVNSQSVPKTKWKQTNKQMDGGD